MRGRRSVAVAALAATAVASCGGVRTQEEPTPMDPASVPEVLLTEQGEATDGEGDNVAPDEPELRPPSGPAVWFIRGREDEVRLLPVARELTSPVNMTTLLEALFDEPSEEERAQNITTAIPEKTELASPPRLSRDEEGVLIVDLNTGIWDVQGPDLRNAFGQIVCTVTKATGVEGSGEVERARFRVNGEPIAVLDGRGAETREPVSCDRDYARLIEEPEDEADDTDDAEEGDEAEAEADDAEDGAGG